MEHTFSEFYSALWKRDPFPWQEELANRVLNGGWPKLLDLPTGAGKTSALDVALYCLSMAPERMPRRCVLVVDRRIVVDQTADHLRCIQTRLQNAQDGVLFDVANRLRALCTKEGDPVDVTALPFQVAVMRGGMPRDNDWARRPDQAVFGVSTVDQVGSRLLFRGYGLRNLSASIHAGLLANDTLILLDEVHLSEPFRQTLKAISQRYMQGIPGVKSKFSVVQMSATATGEPDEEPFRITEKDRADERLSLRLNASKLAKLLPVKVSGDDEAKKQANFAAKAVTELRTLQEDPSVKVVGVVVNRVDTARMIHRMLAKGPDAHEVELMTGRMRALDRDKLVERVQSKLSSREGRSDESLVVVATQCIEAGADFDFDALVSECASLDALRQRFGRLDRRGIRKNSKAVILCRSDAASKTDDPVYGAALAETWKWLQSKGAEVDFGINALQLPPKEELAKCVVTPADAPILMPSHLDAWAQTSPRAYFAPDIEPFLHGCEKPSADVQIIWRSELALPSFELLKDAAEANAVARLSARRPSSLEAISVPIGAAKRWLSGEQPSSIADVMAGDAEASEIRRDKDEEKPWVALRWRGDDSQFVKADELRPGDVLIVPASAGGIYAESFDPTDKTAVTDLGDLAQWRARRVASLLLTPEALAVWRFASVESFRGPLEDEEESLPDTRRRLLALVDSLGEPSQWQGAWREIREALAVTKPVPKLQFMDPEFLLSARPVLAKPDVSPAYTEDDESSFLQKSANLKDHSQQVQKYAAQFAQSVGLPQPLQDALQSAAWFHDVGKADPRFQRWLLGGNELPEGHTLLAKSAVKSTQAERRAARRRARYPARYRHELLSLTMLEGAREPLLPFDSDAMLRDLVLHLVASHHGWCRPFAPLAEFSSDDHENADVAFDHDGAPLRGNTEYHYSRLDSGVSERFWRLTEHYGWWGLAWLESILRLADHLASAQAEGLS